jgi:hypothetical protein
MNPRKTPYPLAPSSAQPKGSPLGDSLVAWFSFVGRFTLYTLYIGCSVGLILTVAHFMGWLPSLEVGFTLFTGLTILGSLIVSILALHQVLYSFRYTMQTESTDERFWAQELHPPQAFFLETSGRTNEKAVERCL